MSFGNAAGPNGALTDPLGGMTPGDALGGGLTSPQLTERQQFDQNQAAQNNYINSLLSGVTGNTLSDQARRSQIRQQALSQWSTMAPAQQQSYAPATMPSYNPGDISMPGPGFATGMPQQPPQPFASPDIERSYQPPPGNPQQIQNIAQGQPTLVNQLAPPPPQGPAPGTSITQVPPPMPQAQPAPQPRPQPQAQPVTQTPLMFSAPPVFRPPQTRPQPQYQAPQQAMNTRFPALAQNTAFARPPAPTVLNPRTPRPEQANINSLNQVLNILQRNPAFAPGAAGQFTLSQLPTRPPLTMRPQALPMPIRQPAAGQVLRRPTAVPYRPATLPTRTTPRR